MPDANKLFELIRIQKWEEAVGLLKSDEGKALAKQADNNGNLPLHSFFVLEKPSAQQRDSYTRLLESLMGVFPDGLKTKNRLYGRLPIHVAMTYGFCSVSGIRKLAEVYPQGLKEKDKHGNLPIHNAVACKYKHDYAEVVALLIDKHREGLKTKNNDGDLPIHEAARSKGSDCIKRLVEVHPNGLKEEDKKGNLPVHILATRYSHDFVLRYVVQKYPEGLKHKNNDGYLPIHLAASTGHGGNMTQLAKHYPESLNELGGNSNESDFSRHPIIQYCSASRLPIYRQDVLIHLHKISAAAPNARIQSLKDLSDCKKKYKKRLEGLRNQLDSVKSENRQLIDEREAADEKRFTIEAEKQKLVGDKASLSDELATTKEKLLNIEEENQKLHGDIQILKEVAVEGRKSELAILASLASENEAVVSIDIAKSIAHSLKARLDGLSAKKQPNSKPSFAQVVFSSVLKDPDVSMASLVQIIESLSTELSKLESQYINGNVTPESTNGAVCEGDNRTHALELSSLDTPGQAAKRARVSLSPE